VADEEVVKSGAEEDGRMAAGRTQGRISLPKPEGYVDEADRWEYLFVARRQGFPVSAVVERLSYPEHLEGPVWELDLGDGIRGVVPFAESGLVEPGQMARFVGQSVTVKIKSMDRETRLVAASRKEAVEDARRRLLDVLVPGEVLDGVVRAVLPAASDGRSARLLVDIGGGVLCEVPRSAATRSRVGKLGAHFSPGQQVRAVVKAVDRESGSISISLVEVESDPWATATYNRGEIVSGRVVSRRGSVVYVEVRPGMVGIGNAPLRGTVWHGDRVSGKVTMYDPGRRRLHLQLLGRPAR